MNPGDISGDCEVPRISVLLPVKNGGKFFGSAVASVLAQTYRNFELLVLDGGSFDGSCEIAAEYAKYDARVRLITSGSKGLAACLNEGLRLCKGEYVARMDADDVALPLRFERQVGVMEADGSLFMCGCQGLIIDKDGCPIQMFDCPVRDGEIQARLFWSNPFIHPGVMFRRAAVLACGGYCSDAAHAEDLELWLRLSRQGRLHNLSELLMYYRMHDHKLTVTNAEAVAQAVDEMLANHLLRGNLCETRDDAGRCARVSRMQGQIRRCDIDYLTTALLAHIAWYSERPWTCAADIADLRRTLRWELIARARRAGYCSILGAGWLSAAKRVDPVNMTPWEVTRRAVANRLSRLFRPASATRRADLATPSRKQVER